jgi:hypothetical protein
MVSVLAESAVDHGIICGVIVSVLALSAVDHGIICGVMVSVLVKQMTSHLSGTFSIPFKFLIC